MPVYEYACATCQRRFERYVQRFGDEVRCPDCDGDVERQLSTFAFASASDAPSSRGAGACCGGGCGCRVQR